MDKEREPDERDGWYRIGVKEATELLEGRPKNRPIKQSRGTRYAHSIVSGEWVENGEPIILSSEGKLLDGQNRLRAVQIAGKAITTYVVHLDVSKTQAFDTMNQGGGRTGGDRLAIMGAPHYTTASAVISKVIQYKNGITKTVVRPSQRSLRLFYQQHKESLDATTRLMHTKEVQAGVRGMIPVTLAAFVHFMAKKHDQEKADSFIKSLATGENISKRNPVFVLRKRLIDQLRDKAVLPTKEVMALTIKAWNAYRAQREVSRLVWHSHKDEPFPSFDD